MSTCRQERLSDRACGITSRAPGEKSPDTFRHPASAFYKSFVDVEKKTTQRKITCPGSFLARVGVSISVDECGQRAEPRPPDDRCSEETGAAQDQGRRPWRYLRGSCTECSSV